MNAQDLRNSILQLAIQGKLVEQRAEEGTAKELLMQIRDKKEQLVEKKIKYEAPLPEITELELPFDLPDNWEWVRLGEVINIVRGASPRPIKEFITQSEGAVNWIKIGDTEKGSKYITKTNEKITAEGMKKSRYVKKGDFLLSNSMSFGRPYILNIDGCIHDGWLALSQLTEIFDKEFLYYLLSSSMVYYQFCGRVSGAVVNNLNSDKVKLTVIPLPPLEEQKRIVTKIEALMPYVEKYGQAHSKLEVFNKKFPEDVQKSILQYAIQGKLVEQRAEEGTAEALYQQIQEEKTKLIKEGKIKKEKQIPAITVDELPFDIPESWKWVRLRDLGWFSGGKTPSMSKTDYWENGDFPWVTSKDMKRKYINSSEMNITQKAANEMTVYPVGTLLMVVRSGILKRQLPLAILTVNSTINQDLKAFTLYDSSLVEYVYCTLKAMEVYILKEYRKQVTTVDSLKFDEFQNMPIPIPPVNEQKRILRRLEEVLQYTHNLIN